MSALSWVQAVLGKGLVEPVANYYQRKAELKQARFEAQLKMEQAKGDRAAELIKLGLTADMNWEMEFARQAENSWKDEYTLIVISIPAIACFIPGAAPYVASGFESLQNTPHWYQLVFISLFLATVGIRYWRRNQTDTP